MVRRSLVFFDNAWCMRELSVEGLPITHTTAQELRSRWHGDMGIEFFWEQAPQLRMVPTELMGGAVAMRADAGTQLLHLRNQFVSCALCKIFIHSLSYHAPQHGVVPAASLSATKRDDHWGCITWKAHSCQEIDCLTGRAMRYIPCTTKEGAMAQALTTPTSHARLCALGEYLRRQGFVAPLRVQVQMPHKTVCCRPRHDVTQTQRRLSYGARSRR